MAQDVADIKSEWKPTPNQKKFLGAMEACGGIATHAAEECGISRRSHQRWMKDPNYADAVDTIQEMQVDHVESKLMERINGVTVSKMTEKGPVVYELPPDVTACIFYLKANPKARARGWGERFAVDPNSAPVSVVINKPKD